MPMEQGGCGMAIQIYAGKGFETQKAERFFKERRVSVQKVDVLKFGISRRELESVRAAVGMEALIDRESKAFLTCPVRFSLEEERVFEYALENAGILRLPIVRNGRQATVGYQPDTWKAWISQTPSGR